MKARYFFIASILSLGIFAWQVIGAQQEANRQAAELVAQDKASQDVALLKQQIEGYVADHMGVRVQVFLEGSYDRAYKAAQTAANPASNGQVYTQAQAACGGRSDSVSQAKCVSEYVAKNSTPSTNPQPMVAPDKQGYTLDLTGPNWSLSLAGVALLASLAAFVMGCYLVVLRHI